VDQTARQVNENKPEHMRTLKDFIGLHRGETAWIFGKGPSLSTFDFKTAGKLRFAINDVIAHIPDCQYGFANDGVAKWADVYKPGQVLFQPSRCLHEYDSTKPGAVACEVVTYRDDSDDTRLLCQPEQLAECLTIRRGTLGSALQILRIMGIQSVHMVGIDGGGTHAEGFEWKTRLRHDHAKDYNAIRSAAIDAAFIMGIALRFHNHDNTMETNGRVFVKMTRNCFAEAKPYFIGEVASFSPKIAGELISNRAAELFSPPVQTPIEAAILPATAETATLPPAKRAAKKARK
jgi:hypothetical protein